MAANAYVVCRVGMVLQVYNIGGKTISPPQHWYSAVPVTVSGMKYIPYILPRVRVSVTLNPKYLVPGV